MSDKTLINLLRIRACDAEFNEADHPRADNGQFTSGGGGGGSAPAEAAPAAKPKKNRKPKVEKDWEPNDAEKTSWRFAVIGYSEKKFNPKKATPKQFENRMKQTEHTLKMLYDEHAHTPRYGGNAKHWDYVNDLIKGILQRQHVEKMRYEDAHKGEQ